jgi:acetyl esterase/lipase
VIDFTPQCVCRHRTLSLLSALLVAVLATPESATAQHPRLPRSVEAQLDQPYAATDNPRQKLDLLLPINRTSDKPLPVIAFIHGGAWRAGNKSGGLRRVVPFVESGDFVGVSIGYRLSGEATWPAQIHDCKAAIRWLRANAGSLGIDADRIGVMGSSAGGHLVAMLGTSGDVADLEGKLGSHTNVSSRVSCVVDEYGPTNFLTMNDFPSRIDHLSPTSPESLLIGGEITEHKDKVRHASPLTYVSRDDPPFLIIHGTQDPLVPYNQSVVLDAALKKAGVDVLLQTISEGQHGSFRSRELARRTHLFFEKYLLGSDVRIPTTPLKVGE